MDQNQIELHVCENGTWSVAERYRASEKDEAINDAKRRLNSPGVASVRVVHEQFDPADSLFKQKTLYRQAKPGAKIPAPPSGGPAGKRAPPPLQRGKAAAAAPAATGPVRGKPGPGPGKKPGAEEEAAEAAPPPKPAVAVKVSKKDGPKGPMPLATRFAVSGGIGAVAGIGVPVALASNVGAAAALGGDVSVYTIAAGAFLAAFGIIFYATGSGERRLEREQQLQELANASLDEFPSIEALDQAAAMPPPIPMAAPQPALTPAPLAPPAAEATPTPSPTPAPAAGAVPNEVQEQRMRLLKLLHDCLADPAAKPYLASGTLDPRNRFGFHLFMLGAGQYAAASAPKDGPRMEIGSIIETALATLGTDAAKAQKFASLIAEYSKDPKHSAMMRAGAETMRDYLRSSKLQGTHLSRALQFWNTAEGQTGAAAEPQGEIVAIMFTDMVSSVAVTQKLGDEGMMKVVQTHNLIVGAVLKTHRGKQVKHTGDGIMAMFPRVADGVAAAAEIQRQVTEYNSVTTSSPLKLRIGVSAGKPIREGDDYFGTVVQTAARLCAVAQADEVVVPDSIRQMPGCEAFAYDQPIAVPLKGFPEPQLVRKVIWARGGGARSAAAG